jgi:hypothetical protein
VDCEVLLARDMVLRAEKMLLAMIESAEKAGVRVMVTQEWRRQAPVLMTYGLGHLGRRPALEAHKKDGGRLVGWDLGYWNRNVPLDFSMRLTIDDDHPHRWIAPMPADRWQKANIALREDANPNGPIVLVGLGRKQRTFMASAGQRWEMRTLMDLRRRYPGREVIYRPKRPERLAGCRTADGSIEDALRGASLVVCHHSNVAVDACIAGVPVECVDGAAFALYRNNSNPTREQRQAFLESLAWWQWTPREARGAWDFIKARLA